MTNFQRMPDINNEKDKQLWEIAENRASFKRHLLIYMLVNVFLWVVWLLNEDRFNGDIPWPVYTTLGWGIGVTSHYLGVYVYPESNSVKREYEKLKKNQQL